jgi:hypothetical protein
MKKQAVSDLPGIFNGRHGKPCIENKEVISMNIGYNEGSKKHGKMKV